MYVWLIIAKYIGMGGGGGGNFFETTLEIERSPTLTIPQSKLLSSLLIVLTKAPFPFPPSSPTD